MSSQSSSTNTLPSGALENAGAHSRSIIDNLIDKSKHGNDWRNMRRKLLPAVSLTSAIGFRDDDVERSVIWAHPSVVTDIHYIPRLTLVEERALFYTEDETRS